MSILNNSIHKTNYMNEGIIVKKDDDTEVCSVLGTRSGSL